MAARIFAVADVFDALTSVRPYKPALTLDEALGVMRRDRGAHFDPAVFDAFAVMAPGLFERISRASTDELTGRLRMKMREYFFTAPQSPAAPEGPDRVGRV